MRTVLRNAFELKHSFALDTNDRRCVLDPFSESDTGAYFQPDMKRSMFGEGRPLRLIASTWPGSRQACGGVVGIL